MGKRRITDRACLPLTEVRISSYMNLKIRTQKGIPKMLKILTSTHAAKLRIALYLDHRPPSTAALLMLQCGFRAYEATMTRSDDLLPSLAGATEIHIPGPNAKRGQERTVPLPRDLADLIFYRVKGSAHELPHVAPIVGPICKSERGGPITVRWLEMWIQKKSKIVLGFSITPYTLRHTFASRARHHCDLATLQLILGHKNLKSTQVYLHPTLAEMRTAIEATNAID